MKLVFKFILIVTFTMILLTFCMMLFIKADVQEPPKQAHEYTQIVHKTTPPEKIHLGYFKLTAYCTCSSCCGKSADGYTASGTKATAGRTIAVDKSIIPFGTILVIDGHKYTAEDTGGTIKGNRIDILFRTHQDALNFGVKHANIYISV